MTKRKWFGPVVFAALSGCGGASSSDSASAAMLTLAAPAPVAPAPLPSATPVVSKISALGESGAPMLLGAQTHFSQGWAASTLSLATQVNAPFLRDSLPWNAGEPRKGSYALATPAAQALSAACAAGRKIELTITPANPLYDGGMWVVSDEGRAAYASYLAALADKFGSCLIGIEMGNEINGNGAMAFSAGVDRTLAYTKIAQAVRARIGGRTAIVAASTNMIGTGFLKSIFANGLLQQVDAVAVHPYRNRGEALDVELDRLNAAMVAAGRRVPIWASEFSLDTTDRALAASELVKQSTMMAASGVATASWYALIDQRWFPTMGLFTGTAPKDQAKAFALMQQLLPLGRPQRIDMGDPLVFAYRFGADATVIWGAPRSLATAGTVTDAIGQPIKVTAIGERPIVIRGSTAIQLGESAWIADTLLGWGTPQWRMFARTGAATDAALPLFDDSFTSYFGDRWFKPLRINNTTAAPAGTGAAPIRAVWRYTAPKALSLDVRGCFSKGATGDGVDVTLAKNGKPVWNGILTGNLLPGPVAVDMVSGDRLDLIVGPNQTFGGDAFTYRVVLFRRGASTAVACPF